MPLIPLVVLAVVAVSVSAAVNAFRTSRAQMQQAAATLGLEWRPSGLSVGEMAGTLNGLAVRVDTVSRDKTTMTRYRVSYPSLGLGLRAGKETVFHRFAQAFRPDIEVGDAEFDRAVTVRGASGDAVRAFLTPERQSAILDLVAASPTASVDDDGIEIRSNRVDKKADLIVTRVRKLAMLAGTISDRPPTPTVAEMRLRRADHDLAGAAAAARAELGADPWLDTRREAAEILYAAGDAATAGEEFRRLERELPDDPDTALMAARATSPPPAPDPAPSAAPPLSAAAAAAALFGGRLLGYEVTAAFDDEMRGRRVQWQGTLERVRESGSGRMAVTVLVDTLDHALFGPVEVVAVADLPVSPRFEDRVGSTVTLSGQLETVDPMMRAFHLGSAAIA